jgi:acyl-CoA hydrolase
MMPQAISPDQLVTILPKGGRVLIQGTTGESLVFAEAVAAAGDALGAMIFTGIFIPGTNRHTYLANTDCRLETFFYTPEIKAAPATQVEFIPRCYNDIRQWLSTIKIDAALFMCAPPDEQGNCSFGPAVDFLAELWPYIPLRIAHINPLMPRTRGDSGIPFSEITAFVEQEQPFTSAPDIREDLVANAIAAHIVPFVPDGACLQMGVGKIPGAALRALTGRCNLRVHSGLIVDEVMDLHDAGALAEGAAIVAGVAMGSKRLYDAISGSSFEFRPVSITHNAAIIAAIPKFISINSALEVDLYGQVHSELGPNGLMSGPGGASDYARAARLSPDGLRIVALPASASKGAISRIVAAGQGAGPVSLGRFDVDVVVTEHGAADVRNLGYDARAEALIAIAPPDHRERLRKSWADTAARL